MDLLPQLLSIFTLGFIGGSIPGSILASTFTEALRKGFMGSLRVIIFALISETIVASLIMFALFSVNIPQSIYYGISLIGAGVLVWLAKQVWSITKINDKGELFSFKKIFLLTIFNGPLWIVWSTVCVPQAYELNQQISGGLIIFMILFELGWLTATLLLTFLFSRFRTLLIKGKMISVVFKIFAFTLLFFAIRLFLTSVTFFSK